MDGATLDAADALMEAADEHGTVCCQCCADTKGLVDAADAYRRARGADSE